MIWVCFKRGYFHTPDKRMKQKSLNTFKHGVCVRVRPVQFQCNFWVLSFYLYVEELQKKKFFFFSGCYIIARNLHRDRKCSCKKKLEFPHNGTLTLTHVNQRNYTQVTFGHKPRCCFNAGLWSWFIFRWRIKQYLNRNWSDLHSTYNRGKYTRIYMVDHTSHPNFCFSLFLYLLQYIV